MDQFAWFELCVVAVIGLFFGSFLNVLADRLSFGQSIMGRSHCDSCKHDLAWYDLIPVLSFIVQKARCRYCKCEISYQYPASELFTMVMYVATWYLSSRISTDFRLHILDLLIVSAFIVMILSDIRYHVLPDEIQIALAIFALVRIYFQYINPYTFQLQYVLTHLYGLIIVPVPLYLIYFVTRGKGMGFGDVKYAAVMGFLLGLLDGGLALYIAFVAGGLFGLLLLIMKKGKMKSKVAFGPFLIVGTYAMLFFGTRIIYFITGLYHLPI